MRSLQTISAVLLRNQQDNKLTQPSYISDLVQIIQLDTLFRIAPLIGEVQREQAEDVKNVPPAAERLAL